MQSPRTYQRQPGPPPPQLLPRPATAAKGEARVGWLADTLAEYITAVKADEVVPALEHEFFRRVREEVG